MIDRLLRITGLQNETERRAKLRRDLIKHEGRIGGELFGPVPQDGHREFFCLDEYTWVWYEEWVDKNKNRQTRMTRYEVRPDGIHKIQDNDKYQQLSDGEAIRLYEAMKAYKRRVLGEMYQSVV